MFLVSRDPYLQERKPMSTYPPTALASDSLTVWRPASTTQFPHMVVVGLVFFGCVGYRYLGI